MSFVLRDVAVDDIGGVEDGDLPVHAAVIRFADLLHLHAADPDGAANQFIHGHDSEATARLRHSPDHQQERRDNQGKLLHVQKKSPVKTVYATTRRMMRKSV